MLLWGQHISASLVPVANLGSQKRFTDMRKERRKITDTNHVEIKNRRNFLYKPGNDSVHNKKTTIS